MKRSTAISVLALGLSSGLAHADELAVTVPEYAQSREASQQNELVSDGPYVALFGGAAFADSADNVGDPFVLGADDVSVDRVQPGVRRGRRGRIRLSEPWLEDSF